MFRLTTLLRSLGNAGALANVRSVLDARIREDWVVDGLTNRLEPVTPVVEPARPETAAA